MGSRSPTTPLRDPGPAGSAGGPAAALPSFDAGDERYQYIDAIGSGGMASVHSLRDLKLLRTVAIKLLDPTLAHRPAEISRFIREAQITAQLDHPNIVPVHELGTDANGNRYFTMKRVEGRTLSEWIAEAGHPPASPDVLHPILLAYLKICEAVGFAHSRGVLHLDLKPDNVMVGAFGQVYVMDWGLALVRAVPAGGGTARVELAVEDSVTDDVRCGTPAFMAPEQAAGLALSESTDIFGLGALLYAILTGSPPYGHEDHHQAMAAAERCAIKLPRFGPEAPVLVRLTQIVKKAMEREPALRFGSVTELRGEVETALRGLPFPALVFAPGARIVVEGEPGDCAYVIVRGSCVAHRTVDGQRLTLNRLTAGSVFGETAILSGGVRTATVEAEGEVVVRVVSRQLFDDSVDMNTPFGAVVMAQADRFRELDATPAAANPVAEPSPSDPETIR